MKLYRSCAAALIAASWVSVFPDGASAAEVRLTPGGCRSYAAWSGNLVWASDLGADREKAKADLTARDQRDPSSIFALMLENFDALWDTKARWEDVTTMLLRDCIQRQGAYGAAAEATPR
jgi:hypothetical protein